MLQVQENNVQRARLAFGAAALIGGLAFLPLAGCYKRVVSARGPGTEGYTIHEPASEDVMFKRFDRWIMGEPEPVKHKRR